VLDGLHRYQTHHPESDGKRWFELVRIDEASQPQALPETVLHSELERQIDKSRKDDAATRTARLEKAPRKFFTLSRHGPGRSESGTATMGARCPRA
jgi:hypothetical protein